MKYLYVILALAAMPLIYKGVDSFTSWRDGLVEEGKAECRNAVDRATFDAKSAELVAALAQVKRLEARHAEDEKEKANYKSEAASMHEVINGAKSDPKCLRPDAVIDTLNRKIKKKDLPTQPAPLAVSQPATVKK